MQGTFEVFDENNELISSEKTEWVEINTENVLKAFGISNINDLKTGNADGIFE